FAALPFALVLVAACSTAASAATPLRETIDAIVEAKWKEKSIAPAPLADDGAFLRRVHLDLVGTIPTADEARAFLDDASPDKRGKLIDRLLDDPRYAEQQRDVWDLLLFSRNPRGYGTYTRPTFQEWLRRQFAENVPTTNG
ncbi:MAG: DUF1549 domain-containing protein, partial [Planctomycetales bacterium]